MVLISKIKKLDIFQFFTYKIFDMTKYINLDMRLEILGHFEVVKFFQNLANKKIEIKKQIFKMS